MSAVLREYWSIGESLKALNKTRLSGDRVQWRRESLTEVRLDESLSASVVW